MRHKSILLNYLYFIFLTITLILASNIRVFGDERVFNCSVTGYYKNPITDKVEDSGGESAMATGQGMVNGVVNKKGKLTMKDGKCYLDFTLSLADFSSKHSFSDAATGAKISCSLIGNGKDDNGKTNKYRAQISNENSTIRISMYVDPMGRSVIYFISAGNLKEIQSGKADKKSKKDAGISAQTPQTQASSNTEGQAITPDLNAAQGQQGTNNMNMQGIQNGYNNMQPQSAYPYVPLNPYLPPNPYTQPNPYMPPNPYMLPNPYMPPNPYMVPNPYFQGADMSGQAGNGANIQFNPNGYAPNSYAPNPNMGYGESGANIAQNVNPDMTAVNPGIEYNNVYSSGTVKGLILSTDKEAEEKAGQMLTKPVIRFNKEILTYIKTGIIAFAVSFGVVLGLNYIKEKKSVI